ncbi:hypothetical protein PF007_g778 [Phytophthora fragariae]|uniref:Uncharacterized protein n=1 Tax=Phytophthora fragariae TaxID=53985 RepID=A0A6A3TN27_9STRA|nr:hypothetical protein PF007_g778 [Phytophthora fragariae]KAE9255174.1 hypothetical protein PF004_g701 [Phytophthora fragariae]
MERFSNVNPPKTTHAGRRRGEEGNFASRPTTGPSHRARRKRASHPPVQQSRQQSPRLVRSGRLPSSIDHAAPALRSDDV